MPGAHKSPRLIADTLWQSISIAMLAAVASRLIVFCRGLLFARTLDADQLGTWSLTINTIQIAASVLVLGVPSAFSRYMGRRQNGRWFKLVCYGCATAMVMSVVFCTIGLFFRKPLAVVLYGRADLGHLVILTLGAVTATVALFLAKGVLRGLRLLRVDSIIELFYNGGFLALLAVLYIAWRRDALANSMSYLAITVLTTLGIGAFAFYSRRKLHAEPLSTTTADSTAWKALVVYSLGSWTAGSLHLVWRFLDRYMLLHFGSSTTDESLERIGDYFVATKLAEPISAIAVLLGVILLPHAAHLWEQRREQEVSRTLRLAAKVCAALLTLAGAGLIVVKDLALRLVVGHVPESASLVMAPIVVTLIAVALCYVLRTYILCRERAWSIALVWGLALAVNILLNLLLIPTYNLYGAVVATLVSALVAMTAVLWLSAREGMQLDLGTVLACGFPLVLLLPQTFMLPAVGAGFLAIAFTNEVVSEDEKVEINDWLDNALRKRIGVRKASSPS